jgi:hypothetical protein
MRILQQHLDFIEYEPKEKEIASAEEAEKKRYHYDEIVVLFTSVEQGDDDEIAKKAIEGTKQFLGKLKVNRVIIYPYAHLSQNLARPKDALEVLKAMERYSNDAGIETYRAPFGWNKAFQIKVKGHPLAEQSRVYSAAAATAQVTAPPVKVSTDRKAEMTEEQMLARVKKSDFATLPETDHRVIGERLDLFSFQEMSPGMVYWHDKGVTLRNLLIEFIRGELKKHGYLEISTPALANTILWRVSGHWDHYKDNMFLTYLGDDEFGLKPMNCPSTFLFYKTRRWSFRDLPLRVADFDQLYRNELSGVASGLFRVKVLTQDDAHIFVMEEQVEDEIKGPRRPHGDDVRGLQAGLQAAHLDDARRPHRDEGAVGRGDRHPQADGAGQGPRLRDEGEGGCVLRPEDRRRHQGLAREGLAVLHHPAGLPDAEEVQADLRGLGREGPHPDSDTQDDLRNPREVHRDHNGALPGQVPGLGRARPGEGPACLGRQQGLRG